MIYFFVVIQSILLLFMAIHDWIDLPPFTNLPAQKKAHSLKFRLIGSAVNAGLVLIPLIVTFIYLTSSLPLWARLLFVAIYGFITFGTITAWWIPYFGGGYMAIKRVLKNIAIPTHSCQHEEITSSQIPFMLFYTFRFGYALDYRFTGSARGAGTLSYESYF